MINKNKSLLLNINSTVIIPNHKKPSTLWCETANNSEPLLILDTIYKFTASCKTLKGH